MQQAFLPKELPPDFHEQFHASPTTKQWESWGFNTQPGPGIPRFQGTPGRHRGRWSAPVLGGLGRQHATQGIKTAPLFCEGLWGGYFPPSRLEPAQDNTFEVLWGWSLLSSVATSASLLFPCPHHAGCPWHHSWPPACTCGWGPTCLWLEPAAAWLCACCVSSLAWNRGL